MVDVVLIPFGMIEETSRHPALLSPSVLYLFEPSAFVSQLPCQQVRALISKLPSLEAKRQSFFEIKQ